MRYLQKKGLLGLSSKVGQATDLFDYHAHIDRTLTYGENKRIISRKLGVTKQPRNDWADYEQYGQRQMQDSYANELGLRDYKKRRNSPKKQYAKSLERDRRYSALPFGRRISSSGRVYYEWRPNHGDANPVNRL